MKKFLFGLPLCVVFASACEYVKSPSPVRPTTVEEPSGNTPGSTHGYPGNGPDLIAYVAARYPDRLAAGVSLDQRIENMQFLRDRIIEIGKCGGMDLGWNLKRGGPEKSNDFLAWRRDDGDMGVDIGFSYDDTSAPLRLQWLEAGFGASYAEYPTTSCP